MKGIIIFLIVVLLIGIAYYLIVYKKTISNDINTSNIPSINNTVGAYGNIPFESGSSVSIQSQLGLGSKIVNINDITPAMSPSFYFNNITDQNVNSHNVLTSRSLSPGLIHFVTKFNNPCSQYIWYNKNMYVSIGTNLDNQGNRTCYYKFDKSILPSQLKIQSTNPPYQCSQFKYYLGSVEYKFSTNVQESGGISGIKYSCIYNKQ